MQSIKRPLPEYPAEPEATASIRQLENATLRSYIGFVGPDAFGQLSVFDRAPRPTSSYTHRSSIVALAASRPLIVRQSDNSSNRRRAAYAVRHRDQYERHF